MSAALECYKLKLSIHGYTSTSTYDYSLLVGTKSISKYMYYLSSLKLMYPTIFFKYAYCFIEL